MRATVGWIVVVALVIGTPMTAPGANSVTVQSDTLRPCEQTVTIGIYIENDVNLSGICVPLSLINISGDAFIQDSLVITAANRLQATLTTSRHTASFPTESEELSFWKCDGVGFETRGGADFASPDAVFFVAAGTSYLPAGSDSASPSLLLQFKVNGEEGEFAIDTTCVTPNNHLLFVDEEFVPLTPAFTLGTITIGDCGCPCFGDPACDSVTDVLDVVATANVAFRGADPVFDEGCDWPRTDINLTGVTTVMDLVRIVNVVFRGQTACSHWSDPCDAP